MKVLLIYPKVTVKVAMWMPLGILYIASYIKKHGIEVKIINSSFYELNDNNIKEIFQSFSPDIVGIGAMTVQCVDALKIGSNIKRLFPNIKLVYGGVHFTFLPEEGLDIGDIVVIGEGEETFLDICNNKNIKEIEGIAYKEKGKIIKNKLRQKQANLDNFPIPAYDLIDKNRYSDELITSEKATSILTGRGCPHNCHFCASPQLYERKVRFHSIEYTMNHIKYLIDNYNMKNLRIMDDTFTCNNKRVYDFCDAIEKNNFKLNMTCLTNVKNADIDVFKRMKEVGFSIVAFGIETVNEKVQEIVNKKASKEKISKAINDAHSVGLKTELLFMVGNMGETKESLEESLNFSRQFNSFAVFFQFATAFPGSKFYTDAEKWGIVKTKDWDSYNHNIPTFIPHGLNEQILNRIKNVGTKNP